MMPIMGGTYWATWRLRTAVIVFIGMPATACTGENPGANDNQNQGAVCGNELVEAAEVCDGSDLAGDTCQSLGWSGGSLSCQPGCQQYDTSLCSLEAVCGNGLIEPPEVCDGSSLSDTTCAELGFYTGTLACLADCTSFDTSGCVEHCGDGVINGSEVCDGTDFGNDSCLNLGFDSGSLSCSTDCQVIDDSSCTGYCGDGVISGTEVCDGTDFGDDTCQSHGFYSGDLSCSTDCQVIVVSSCAGYCGDHAVSGSEVCDGMNFDGDSCQVRGFYTGSLSCSTDCQVIDDSGCAGECGDGVMDSPEACDGTDFRSDSCQHHGFYSGSLSCSTDCQVADDQGCSEFCGDGVINGPETCEGGAGGAVCTSIGQGYTGGVLTCNTNCWWGTSSCTFDPTPITWISIPGGSFEMGSVAAGQVDERPVHTVSVASFELTKTEVTVTQYAACVNDGGACTVPSTSTFWCNWADPGYEDHPVNCVSWYQAVDFCAWVGGRLLSESEWEYAARSRGLDIYYPWGDAAPTCTYAVMHVPGGGYGCGMDRTWPVCSKAAGNTSQGLCDMAGNVHEWVADWYHSDYSGAPVDGSPWLIPAGTERVIRGGNYHNGGPGMRAAVREDYLPHGGLGDIGFRCAR